MMARRRWRNGGKVGEILSNAIYNTRKMHDHVCELCSVGKVAFRVFVRKTFAERNAKFCFGCVKFLREITALCAIFRKNHFAQNFVIPHLLNPVLRNCVCAIPLFLNVHII